MSTPNPRSASRGPPRGPPGLQPIKTQFTHIPRARPPTTEEVSTADRTPLRPTELNKEHKASFRNIFRPKPTQANSSILQVPPTFSSSLVNISTNSFINLPGLSESVQYTPIPVTPDIGTPAKRIPLSTKSKRERSGKSLPAKSATLPCNTCDPVPLFQVYSQSIKHAKLVSPTRAADTIIRISNQRRNHGLGEGTSQITLREGEEIGRKDMTKKSGRRQRYGRSLAGSISKVEWTEKIYVLVTSGYLLQYAGEGLFDRLPEKMLRLCKDSVVFASDAIPGKHHVLQISQWMHPDGIMAADSRSLFSRLSFRSADYRRTTPSFLLILENAEEMDAWISVIRGEIESLGGKKHVSETGKPEDNQPGYVASPRLVPRSPYRFSAAMSPTSDRARTAEEQFNDGLASITSRPLSGIRQSLDSPSTSTTATSREEAFPDSPRDNYRFSYMSSKPTTICTSRRSSPSCSPTRDAFLPAERYQVDHLRANAMEILDRRRSVKPIEPMILAQSSDSWVSSSRTLPPISSRRSTAGYSGQHSANAPLSPSYEISSISGWRSGSSNFQRSPKSTPDDILEDPAEPNMMSTRKRSTAAILLGRPLTPVEDSHSPPSTIHAYTPRLDALQILPQDRSDPRPDTFSEAIKVRKNPELFSKRFSNLATVPIYDLREFESSKPPPNIPLPVPPAQFQDPTSNLQAPLTPQTSNPARHVLRRPMSMQLRTTTHPPVSLHHHPGRSTYLEISNRPSPPRRKAPSSPPSFSQAIPEDRPMSAQSSAKELVCGPPLVPPPQCALPPLPPGV